VQAVTGDGAVLCKGLLLRFYLEFTLRFAGRLISSRSGHSLQISHGRSSSGDGRFRKSA